MCPNRYAPRRKPPILTTTRRVNGANGTGTARRNAGFSLPAFSSTARKNRRQFVRRYDFKLCISALARLLVFAPPSEMRHVPEASTLHVLISDLGHQLGPQRFPRQVLPLAPAALATRNAMPSFTVGGHMLRPFFPRVIGQRVLAIRRQVFYQRAPLLVREARAHAHMLQRAGIVEESEQQRADGRALALLVPSKPGDHAVAIPLVFDLEHHALVRFVGPRNRLGHDAIETSALEAAKPIRRDTRFSGCWR